MLSARPLDRRRRALVWTSVLIGVLLFFQSSPVLAEAETFEFVVTVLHATPEGVVGKGAGRYDRLLRRQVRYEGLRVVKTKRATVATRQIGSVPLPDGDTLRFRPIDPEGPGALVAVDVGSTQGDFRMTKGKPLIFGGSAWKGGLLVVVLEIAE
ncbi:MAG: hypothetical protein JRH01_19310 [Deltaproteobacteria bacterium]|nr:hypothetical protein [Deltaproteobacteria bacterium]